jgi:hypothetical protein
MAKHILVGLKTLGIFCSFPRSSNPFCDSRPFLAFFETPPIPFPLPPPTSVCHAVQESGDC